MSRTFINLPVNRYDDFLSWDGAAAERLARKAYEVAMKVGCHIEEEDCLKEIESKGGKVDWDRRSVVPTEEQLDEVCQIMRKTEELKLRADAVECDGFGGVQIGNGGNLFFDWDGWTVKAPTVDDLVWTCRFAQGNDDVSSLFAPFMLKDLHIVLEPMYTYAVMARYCRKPVYHPQATEPVQVKYMDRMAHVVEKHRGYFQAMPPFEWINPPFRLGGRGIATMMARIDLGACDTMAIGPMTVSGMSAPLTVAGTAVVAAAEILTSLNALHLMRPAAGLKAAVVTGELDMATARVKYYSFRAHKQNIATCEIFRRGLSIPLNSYEGYREANEPGMQACYEYGMSQAFWTALRGREYPEVGGLSCGNMFSPEQAIMDIEIIKELDELASGFESSDEAVGVDEIITAGFEQGYHMSSDHTIAHMREHIAVSDFFFRGFPAGADHDKNHTQTRKLMEQARERSLAACEKGKEIDTDDELGDDLWELVVEAAREIGADVPATPHEGSCQ